MRGRVILVKQEMVGMRDRAQLDCSRENDCFNYVAERRRKLARHEVSGFVPKWERPGGTADGKRYKLICAFPPSFQDKSRLRALPRHFVSG